MSAKGKKSSARKDITLHDVMGVLHTMTAWMGNTDVRLTTLERGQNQIKATLSDVQDDLTSALAAVDKDSVTLIDHERRIGKLERAH